MKRPKKAHLFPALKNLVPMATERAGRAGGGERVAREHEEGRGRGGGRPPAGEAEASPGRQDGCCRRPPVPSPTTRPRRTPPSPSWPVSTSAWRGGTEAGRVSVLGKGTAWTLHLTALPSTQLLPAGRTGGCTMESQGTESGAGMTGSPERTRRVALPRRKGKARTQVPASPTFWGFTPT